MAVKFKDTININDSYTLPIGDGTTGQVMTTDGSGNITFGDPGGDGEVVKIECKNTSGSTITKGTPVYISGTVGSSFRIEVAPADASNVAKMPAVGVLETDLVNNGQGYVVTGGILKNLITTPIGLDYTSVNDTLYVAVGGGLSAQPPSGANYIQNIGKVARVSTTASGSIVVSSILRTNQVPAPLFVNVANQKVGIKPNGYHSPSVSLDISATDAVQMPAGTTVQRPTGANGMFRYNSTDNQFEGYADGAWGAIAGGGGSGSTTVERRTYTADGSTLSFDIGQPITNENNVFVYIDGVYQDKSTFSVSGSTLTFGTGNEPPNGTSVEIISYAQVQPENASSLILDEFVGTGSQTNFTLSAAPRSENTTFVFIQGVYQEKGTYSVSGNTLAFTTAPQNNFSVEVMSLTTVINVADIGQIESDTFSGDGTTTAFTLSLAPANIAHTLVYINGVYQEKSTYSLSGTTLTFSTAPEVGDSVEVESRKTITPQGLTLSNLKSDLFTATAGQTSFTLVNGTPTAKSQTLVYINGVYQNKSTYSFTNGAIVLSTGAAAGDEVEVVSLEGVAASPLNGVSSVNGQTGDVTVASSKYDVSVISASANAQAFYAYVFTANLTLTLPATPEVGQWIKISNRSGVATCVLGRNGNNIMGAALDLTLDAATASFELIYSGTAQGWVIIGQ